jgi:hypothetical protein
VPPLPSIENCGILKMFATIGDHTDQQVVHFNWGGGPASVSDLLDIATIWETNWNTSWVQFTPNYVSSDLSLVYTTIRDLSSPTANRAQYTETYTGSATQQSSAGDCILLSHQVALAYRGGHPRTYVYGATTDNIAAGGQTWIDDCINQALAAWTAAKNAVADWSYGSITNPVPGMVSYYSGGARRETPVFYPFLDTTVSNIIRSQRRRVRRTPTPT